MVISGGVSLGAYQAGGTWAELERLSRARDTHRLAVVTGASAGNINAFLSAIYWCDAESPAGRVDRTVFANPFFDVWANIGWDKLLPTPGDGAAYARLFADAVGSATFRTLSGRIARTGGPTATWFDAASPYTDEDGLFTRSAFAAAEAFLAQRLESARTTSGVCEVSVGVTVTRSAAAEYPLETVSPALGPPGGGEPLAVPTQRYVVPLVFRVTPGEAGLRNALSPTGAPFWAEGAHRRLARALHLPAPGAADAVVPPRDLLRLVKASSAFPVVFAPIRLTVCLDPTDVGAARVDAEASCPAGTVGVTERFADGGFFDNVPLGLAMELAQSLPGSREPVESLYVDPENRRGGRVRDDAPRAAAGLDLAFGTLSDAIDEARTFELQGLARHAAREVDCSGPSCPAGPRRFRASSRYHPIVGAYLVHNFAAFTHRVFRVHDYLVGVYDSLFAAVAPTGTPVESLDAAGLANLLDRFAALVAMLGLDREVPQPPDGVHRPDELVWRLLGEELADRVPVAVRAAYCGGADRTARAEVCSTGTDAGWRTRWPCLGGGARPHEHLCPAPVAAVHETLRRLDRGDLRPRPDVGGPGVVPTPAPEEDFEGFVRALGRVLSEHGLDLPAPDVPGANALVYDDGPADGRFRSWSRTQKMRFLERARAVEARDAEVWRAAGRAVAAADAALFGIDLQDWGLLGLRAVALTEPPPRELIDLDPSTVDAHAPAGSALHLLHLFPWTVGYDARHLGPSVGWEPRLCVFDSPVTPRLRGELTLTRLASDPALLSRVGAGFGVDGWLGATAVLTVARLPATEGAPAASTGGGVALGLDIARTLRFVVGVDRLFTPTGARPVGTDAALYVQWAFLDVNGGLAWLLGSP